MRGIYLHLPFCVRKCAYCDFYSVPVSGPAAAGFPDLLVREMDLFKDRFPEEAAEPSDTVYLGGGTPTVLGPEVLRGLLSAARSRFPVDGGAEVTVEANPGTVSAADLAALRGGGFTRVSVGAQSFSPSTLRTLGRIHGAEEIRRTVREARSAGFPSVGIDLIFGIPGQSPRSWEEDLDRTLGLRPCHVSAYALAPEPGTPIHDAVARGLLRVPPDDEVSEMYEAARSLLAGGGLRQYEISNFARAGSESRHNRKYWRRSGYYGFGPSAHGLLFPPGDRPAGLRTANPPSLADYGKRIREGRIPWDFAAPLSAEEAWRESLFLGLRMAEGVDPGEIERGLGPPPGPLREAVRKLIAEGLLERERGRLRLPDRYFFVSNEIFSRLA